MFSFVRSPTGKYVIVSKSPFKIPHSKTSKFVSTILERHQDAKFSELEIDGVILAKSNSNTSTLFSRPIP